MRKMSTWTVAVVLAGLIPLAAGAGTAPQVTIGSGSTLELHGKSTMHDYQSKATRMDLKVDVASDVPAGATALERLAAPGAVRSFVLTIPVLGLKSEKDGLDKNLYKAVNAERNPNIVFRMALPAMPAAAADGAVKLTARGELELAGQTRPIELEVTAKQTPQGVVVDGRKSLLMSHWGIKPPSMMLGALKTADGIDVVFHLVLPVTGL